MASIVGEGEAGANADVEAKFEDYMFGRCGVIVEYYMVSGVNEAKVMGKRDGTGIFVLLSCLLFGS